jgi:hypothetical protein
MTALEVIAGRVVNPGAAFTALTPNSSNTFNVRDFPKESMASLEGIWTQQASAGQVRVRSPRFHDDVQGIREIAAAGSVRNLFGDEYEQRLYPNDPLRFDMTGGAAETDSAAMLVYYRDLGGINARLELWETIKPRIVDLMGQVIDVAGPATAGDWSGGTAINATNDNLKADTDYAILGYVVQAECLAIGIAGTDTGNIRVGGPGPVEAIETRDWFIGLSKAHGTPHIPVINSNNRGNTLVFVARNTAAGTVSVSLMLARLSR